MTPVQISTAYAFSMLGTPYIWGGQNRDGCDCSGFVQMVLGASGNDPVGDQTAQGLYNRFKEQKILNPQEGCLVFYGKDTAHIHHVGYCISTKRMIEAGGGDSSCKTVAIARAKQAEVKISLITRRSDVVGYVNPFI